MLPDFTGAIGKRHVQVLALGLGCLGVVWILTTWIVAGTSKELLAAGVALALAGIFLNILQDWRSGFYLLIVWLLFEDLFRKYLGNNMLIYFGKDLLAGVTYLSLFFVHRREVAATFRPPFKIPLMLFFWLALLQVFNPASPSIVYGLLGLKLYFYYVPLMFVGYALIRTGKDLDKLLAISIVLGVLIALIGIVQATVNINFLNPRELAPELQLLGQLRRRAPLSGALVLVPTGVFVSGGRFSWYIILVWILAMAGQGYLLMRRPRWAIWGFLGVGVVTVASTLTGTRSCILWVGVSFLVMSAAFLWGAPWRWAQGRRLIEAVRRSFAAAGIALLLALQLFPQVLGANWSFFSETLSPESQASELTGRAWDYPIKNLSQALSSERWLYGYGTGTSSLGVEYVTRLFGAPPPLVRVESGYGTLIVEMGILGPVLWLVWTLMLLHACWKIVQRLRETVLFPVGFAIFWFAFLLLISFTYLSIGQYQNFVLNAYLWLLVGVLFRLPALVVRRPAPERAAVQTAGVRAARAELPVRARS
jgi:hypothetical protein